MRLVDAGDVVRMALRTLARSPLRSGLTILGLAIGVAAFIAMTSFGRGARKAVVAQFSELGTNVVRAQSLYGDPAAGPIPARPLDAGDVAELRRSLTGATAVVPSARTRATASANGRRHATFVYGTTPQYFAIHLWSTSGGGFFDETDEAQRAKVCVVGATVAARLSGDREALGSTIALGDALSCTVVGLLAPKGVSTTGKDLDDFVVVPLSTYEAYFGLPEGYSDVEIEARGPELLGSVRGETELALRRTHHVTDDARVDVVLSTPTQALRAARTVSSILTRLLAAIAAVSLIVGGIGIMNIQLVAVAERTREIGIRAALGASPGQILAQFLAEAVTLSSIGAFVGVTLGAAISLGVGRFMRWTDVLDPVGIAGASAFGIVAGVVFGYVPARRAAELDPVEALRHE